MLPCSESVLARVTRIRRFATLAARGLGDDLRFAARTAARLPLARQMRGTVRHAWLRSDPDWSTRLFERMAPSPEQLALLGRERRERENTRALLAAGGPAVYEGRVEARVANGGLVLADHQERRDVCDWLCDVLGLDGWGGDGVHVRISVGLQDDPPSATPAQGNAPPPQAEPAAKCRPQEPELNHVKEEFDEHDSA